MSLLLVLCFFLCSPTVLSVTTGTGSLVFYPFLQAAYNAYKLIDPKFNMNYIPVTNGGVAINNFATNITYDFAIIDAFKPTPEQYAEGLQIFPFLLNTIVAQVNFDFNANIVLNRTTLADIFMGKITNWNDSSIRITNPKFPLPNATIQVFYRSDSSQLNSLFSTLLSAFSPEWNATYGVAQTFPLALQGLPNFHAYSSAIPLNGAVASVTNSIGYTPFYLVSRDPSLYYVELIHKGTGKVMECNGDTLEAASNNVKFNAQLDANFSIDNPDPNAWPIASHIWMMIRNPPGNCKHARGFFKFIRWTLLWETGRDTISQGGCGPLPYNISNLVVDTLEKIECEGESIGSSTDEYNTPLSYWFEDTVFVIAMVLLLMGLILSGVHIYHFSTSQINVAYSIIFVIGTTLTLISPVFWFMPPDKPGVCGARIWSSTLGFAILLGTMFSRTWQLNDIYQLQKHGRKMDQLRFKATTNKTLIQLGMTLLGVIFTNLLILIIWTGVDPLRTHWVVVDQIALTGYHTCSCTDITPWLLLFLFFFLFLLCFGVYVIYNTWSFQRQALLIETRYVLLALYNVILNICAVVPLLAFITITERVLALVVVVSIDISGCSIICAVLLPRLVQKLELSKTDSKGSSERKAGSVRSPATGTITSGKRKEKAEFSRTPEDELAKRLEEPLPLMSSPMKGLIIDRDGSVKVEGTKEQIELCSIPVSNNKNARFNDDRDDSTTDTSTEISHIADRSPHPYDRSPHRGMAILEEDERLEESTSAITPSPASPPRKSFPYPSLNSLRNTQGQLGSFDSETGLLQSFEESSGGIRGL